MYEVTPLKKGPLMDLVGKPIRSRVNTDIGFDYPIVFVGHLPSEASELEHPVSHPEACLIQIATRRLDFLAEIKWVQGQDLVGLKRVLMGVLAQCIYEGRKRVEAFVPVSQHAFIQALTLAGFHREGYLPHYTDELEGVEVWGWTIPEHQFPLYPDFDLHVFIASTPRVEKFYERNIQSYRDDRQYMTEIHVPGHTGVCTFGELLESYRKAVVEWPCVTQVLDWSYRKDPEN